MHVPLRSAFAALAATMLLVTVSCSSSSSESARPSPVSVTASAWVQPAASASGSASLSSGTTNEAPSSVSASTNPLPDSSGDLGLDPYFAAASLPVGLSSEDQQQAKAAIEAYAAYWTITRRATSDPSMDWSRQISEVATGSAAKNLEESIAEFREQKYRVDGQAAVRVTVRRVEAGAVELGLCVDGSGGRVVDASGAPINDSVDTTTRRPGYARVGEYTSGWKVDTNVYDMASAC